jgi:glycerate kinase
VSTRNRVPRRVLLAGAQLGGPARAQRVLDAISGGLEDAGLPGPDVCALPEGAEQGPELQALLEDLRFDARMRSARALILAVGALREQELAGSAVFELATRARQAGVPCYAIAGETKLNAFDRRIMDLQLVLEARTPNALLKASKQLAGLV